ncbi:unnamed protein product [Polarella glacialis]|uniref:catechol O-methyltransferase n=2 Tax=Polarella glacialis TaxID=89957 RepID=A0A813EEL5_POLGL|nr:unnamed protein product [Polarella glacialis]
MSRRLISRFAAPLARSLTQLPRVALPGPQLRQASGVVNAETIGNVMRVDKDSVSIMFGRERQLLIHVINTAKEGDAESVMAAMDSFWSSKFGSDGTDSWTLRADVLEKALTDKKPGKCLEIGTYCGYSALRIARHIPEGGLLVSIELDPLFAAIATKIVEHAGLSHKVKILMGTVEAKADRISDYLLGVQNTTSGLPSKQVDFILCDHSKSMFVPDLKLLESFGVVGPGTMVVGDTTVYPGDQAADVSDLLTYFATNPNYRVQSHQGTQQTFGITVSEWVHLP